VRRAHPGFERSERMLDGLAPQAHFSRVLVEPALHDFEKLLMLPSRDPALFARRALALDRAALADVGPITPDKEPFLIP